MNGRRKMLMNQLSMQAAAALLRIEFDIGFELSCHSNIKQGNRMSMPAATEMRGFRTTKGSSPIISSIENQCVP